MISARRVRTWYRLHKWTSLLCTLFLLVSCLTGLPLIFHDEIDHWVSPTHFSGPPVEVPPISFERAVTVAKQQNPTLRTLFVTMEEDEPQINVGMSAGLTPQDKSRKLLAFDAYTAANVTSSQPGESLMDKLLLLHRALFAGVPGELFMGAMALLFVIALISGALVYGPFMRRLDFGTLRRKQSRRLHWFDLHNLLGIVTLCWALIVGATGVMNALSTPLFAMWRATAVPQLLASYANKPPAQKIITPDQAADAARRALPQMKVTGIIFPNPIMSTAHHFLVYTKGRTPVTSRLFTPVLVDAETGQVAMAKPFPWYIRTLEVSRPLHFGDYGGLPLKVIWSLFDVATIIVLLSGIYLWLSRRRTPVEDELDKLVHREESSTGPASLRAHA
ncbi:PepSY-associated TM helix domain-containing protein [Granulicella sp. dw_53]|uniref:PepSY-associated TM helix domain-containing protein n=1 Tax=Granulicella sp. dw_53 TaxID=2719792 RepID=UPI001BD678D1|nr:PepSY-associated TM helix domain-containing protein [Granulicella sp. dw_53]